MSQALTDMIGKQVRVDTSVARDIGILESYDHPWLRLRKSDGKILCLAVYSIRLVEPWPE
jgi:hypothetical protein